MQIEIMSVPERAKKFFNILINFDFPLLWPKTTYAKFFFMKTVELRAFLLYRPQKILSSPDLIHIHNYKTFKFQ